MRAEVDQCSSRAEDGGATSSRGHRREQDLSRLRLRCAGEPASVIAEPRYMPSPRRSASPVCRPKRDCDRAARRAMAPRRARGWRSVAAATALGAESEDRHGRVARRPRLVTSWPPWADHRGRRSTRRGVRAPPPSTAGPTSHSAAESSISDTQNVTTPVGSDCAQPARRRSASSPGVAGRRPGSVASPSRIAASNCSARHGVEALPGGQHAGRHRPGQQRERGRGQRIDVAGARRSPPAASSGARKPGCRRTGGARLPAMRTTDRSRRA